MKYIGLVALLALSLGVASPSPDCGGQQDTGPNLVPYPVAKLPHLAGSSWTLVGMGDGGNLQEVSAAPPVTLEFMENGAEMKGDTGCNAYFGSYDIYYTSGSLRILDLEITEIGCPSRDLFEREVKYRDALAYAQSATFNDSRLTIKSASGWTLVLVERGGIDVAGGVEEGHYQDEN